MEEERNTNPTLTTSPPLFTSPETQTSSVHDTTRYTNLTSSVSEKQETTVTDTETMKEARRLKKMMMEEELQERNTNLSLDDIDLSLLRLTSPPYDYSPPSSLFSADSGLVASSSSASKPVRPPQLEHLPMDGEAAVSVSQDGTSGIGADGSVTGGGNSHLHTCLICYEDFPAQEMFTIGGCSHSFCLECMRRHLTVTLVQWGTAAVSCPTYGCKSVLLSKECEEIADGQQMALMIQREEEEKIHVSDRVYCPNPHCSHLMSKRSLGASKTGASPTNCPKCNFNFCVNCRTKWHSKKTCAEFVKSKAYKKSDEGVFDAAAKTLGWMKCQKCRSIVDREDGCNHITCSRCKHEFCYSCGAPCKKKKPTCKCTAGS